MTLRRLLIVGHVPSEHTHTLRNAVESGASDEGCVEVRALSPFEAGADDVKGCDAIILGTTENFGYMSGALKDFFDRIYYPCLEVTQGLAYALYIKAGHDGTGTERAVEAITKGLRWKSAHPVVLCRGAYEPAFAERCRALGQAMALALEAEII